MRLFLAWALLVTCTTLNAALKKPSSPLEKITKKFEEPSVRLLRQFYMRKKGGAKKIKHLVDVKNADINYQTPDDITPLFVVVRNRDVYGVELVIGLGANVNNAAHKGITPLIQAVKSGNEAIVKLLLLNKKLSLDPKDSDGRSALMWAVRADDETMVNLLLQRDAPAEDEIWNAAIIRGNKKIIRLLYDARIDQGRQKNPGWWARFWWSPSQAQKIKKPKRVARPESKKKLEEEEEEGESMTHPATTFPGSTRDVKEQTNEEGDDQEKLRERKKTKEKFTEGK